MRRHFKQQLEQNMRVTQQKLDNVSQKTYTSGREIRVGEVVLFAILVEGGNKEDFICLHEEELDDYEYVGEGKDIAPKIRKKQVI